MVNKCSVTGCNNTSQHDVQFYKFPKSRSMKRKWMDTLKLSKVSGNSLICSCHFTEQDYDTVRGRLRLKSDVVPSLLAVKSHSFFKSASTQIEDINHLDNITNAQIDISAGATEQETIDNSLNSMGNSPHSIDNSPNTIEKPPHPTDKPPSTTDKPPDPINNGHNNRNFHSIFEPKSIDEKLKTTNCGLDNNLERKPILEDINVIKEDIEDILTNYQIKQNKRKINARKHKRDAVNRSKRELRRGVDNLEDASRGTDKAETVMEANGGSKLPPDKQGYLQDAGYPDKSVYIEISIGRDTTSVEPRPDSAEDCVMMVEDVQVDVDPSNLLPQDRDSDVEHVNDERKMDPISLLTSSDEDDVIIQEPHIDTIEVSDEDEDDVPLIRLARNPKSNELKLDKGRSKLVWGVYEYDCAHCDYRTVNRVEFTKHRLEHPTAIQICEICSYKTASKASFNRHKRKHKDYKQFKCSMCEYRAKHSMSLEYHVRTHKDSDLKKVFKCDKCRFTTGCKNSFLRHMRSCYRVSFKCSKCDYVSKRKSDLKRHKDRRHNLLDED